MAVPLTSLFCLFDSFSFLCNISLKDKNKHQKREERKKESPKERERDFAFFFVCFCFCCLLFMQGKVMPQCERIEASQGDLWHGLWLYARLERRAPRWADRRCGRRRGHQKRFDNCWPKLDRPLLRRLAGSLPMDFLLWKPQACLWKMNRLLLPSPWSLAGSVHILEC